MYRLMFFVIAVLAITSMSYAQTKGKITGKITTSDGYPAEYISVVLDGTHYGTTSDRNGNFTLEAPAGSYTMAVFSMIAHRKEMPVTIAGGQTSNLGVLKVLENKTQLSEVVVTGQFNPQSLKASIYKTKIITKEQIAAKGATSMQGLLNTELGMRLSNDMALGETDFELMGMSGNNVKVLLDGIPLVDRLATKQSLSQIDLNTIERIEIVEGPMSVVYGSDALAGVINIITKKVDRQSEKAWSVGARLQEETVGKEYHLGKDEGSHTQSANAEYQLKNGLFFGGSYTRNDFGGWQGSYTGRAKQWQPKEQVMPGARIGYKDDKFSAWYRFDYLYENLLTMSDVNLVTNTTADKEFMVDRFTHQLQSDWKANAKLNFALAASYQDYHRRTRTTDTDLSTGKRTLSLESGAQDKTEYSTGFARITAVWKPSSVFSLQPGLEYQTTSGVGNRISTTKSIANSAFFVSAEYTPFKWLSIRPGFRTNYNSVFEAPKAVPALNAKAALNDNMDLRLSYGRGYRAPTLQELYYSFHDSNHNIDGNPDLKAEHSNSYMASFVWRSTHNETLRMTHTLSGFYNDYRNKISLTERADKPGYYMYYNIDRYKTTGATFENSLYWKALSANLNFSYIGRYNSYYGEVEYASADMPQFRFSPEITANVSYDLKRIGAFNVFYKFTGQRLEYMLDSNNKMALLGLNSFHWCDITYNRNITSFLKLSAGVKNLFNITNVYSSAISSGHGTSSADSQLGCGRSYFAGLALNL